MIRLQLKIHDITTIGNVINKNNIIQVIERNKSQLIEN